MRDGIFVGLRPEGSQFFFCLILDSVRIRKFLNRVDKVIESKPMATISAYICQFPSVPSDFCIPQLKESFRLNLKTVRHVFSKIKADSVDDSLSVRLTVTRLLWLPF